ncbi:hypothetical protein ACU635_59050 [[Actinomadura] parvosata]|uniref:hypothetical protein n=1 Tax=[Actinomadura] parvosata TaxID=1955412 RepID=UPI00406D022D
MADISAPRRRKLTHYGPIQLCTALGLFQWQFERGLRAGLIPEREAAGWPAAVVDELRGRADEIRQATGAVPDMGAHRAAALLADRFPDLQVTPDAVAELARRTLIPEVGDYKGHPLYCGRTLETFADREALERAIRDGELRTADEVAAYLRVRRSDVDHLVNAGWLEAAGWGMGPFQRRSARPRVPLYRTADLDVLAAHPRSTGIRCGLPRRAGRLRSRLSPLAGARQRWRSDRAPAQYGDPLPATGEPGPGWGVRGRRPGRDRGAAPPRRLPACGRRHGGQPAVQPAGRVGLVARSPTPVEALVEVTDSRCSPRRSAIPVTKCDGQAVWSPAAAPGSRSSASGTISSSSCSW